MQGQIIKNISNDYTVKTKEGNYICKPRGNLKYYNHNLLVGDNVIIDPQKKIITSIEKRKNSLIRPSIANIDIAFIVTPVYPKLDLILLDKLITIISYNNIEPIICFTKLDLIKEDNEILKYISYYQNIGITVIKNTETAKIKELIKNKIAVLSGQSGSGKSTLLNNLSPGLNLKTNEISQSLGRGKHTTRHTELYNIFDGFIADTPGFSSLDFIDMDKREIRDNFKEMFDNLPLCKYRDCFHDHEDGCYVKSQLEKEIILKTRYQNYLSFIRGVK